MPPRCRIAIVHAPALAGRLRFDQADEGIFHGRIGRGRCGRRLDRVRRAHGQDFAGRHDREAVAVFGFFHEMGGHHDGDALLGKRIDALPEFAPRERIDARSRFIQKQDIRFMHQGAGQCQTLLVAQGQIAAGGVRQGARANSAMAQCMRVARPLAGKP